MELEQSGIYRQLDNKIKIGGMEASDLLFYPFGGGDLESHLRPDRFGVMGGFWNPLTFGGDSPYWEERSP